MAVTAHPVVRRVRAPIQGFGDADGTLMSAGLAYLAIFAVVSGLLLLISVLILAGDSPEARDAAVSWLIARVPPLEALATQIVEGLADGARVGSIVGLIAFTWGLSGFYLGLHDALDRLFPAQRRRNRIIARIQGIVAILLLVVAIAAVVALGSLIAAIDAFRALAGLGLGTFTEPVLTVLAAIGVLLVVYRWLPSDPPSVREAAPSAIVAGVIIGFLTALFGLIAPLLVGSLAGLGVITSVFVALIWFSWVFRVLLYGAAEACVRRDEARGLPLPGEDGTG